MITRENLVSAICNSDEVWTCPEVYNGECFMKHNEDVDLNDCIRCSEHLLAEYEKRVMLQKLEELKQIDYELFVASQGYSHLDESQWEWLIKVIGGKR